MQENDFFKNTLSDRQYKSTPVEVILCPEKRIEGSVDVKKIAVNGEWEYQNNTIIFRFSGDAGVYQPKLILDAPVHGNGMAMRLCLDGWDDISYVAIGHTEDGNFTHVKVKHVEQGEMWDISFGPNDLLWQIQNGISEESYWSLEDVRVFVKGTPGNDGARLSLERCCIFNESTASYSAPLPEMQSEYAQLESLAYKHYKKYFTVAEDQANRFMNENICPLTGGVVLPWAPNFSIPDGLVETSTHQFSWHALHPALILLLFAFEKQQESPLYPAREFILNWIDKNINTFTENQKYVWYDHGTGERLVVLCLLWVAGIKAGFEKRFFDRMREAIYRHGQLLSNEAFYAKNQDTRYHNHAMFQDLSLLVAGIIVGPQSPAGEKWISIGKRRLENQIEHLVVEDGDFCVLIENSIGYHRGMVHLIEFVDGLLHLAGQSSKVSSVLLKMKTWSDFLSYPDGRTPAQGDTFRLPPAMGDEIRRGVLYKEPSVTVLPKAGYAVVKGNHDEKPWMLCLFNTSLSKTHKHEDNLSITFWFDGVEWLIDPSFYSHEYEDETPQYLRSALAHNLPFVKIDKNKITDIVATKLSILKEEENYTIVASYSNTEGVELIRSINLSINSIDFKITDKFKDDDKNKTYKFYSSFHFGEIVKPIYNNDLSLVLECEKSNFSIKFCLDDVDSVQLLDSVAAHGFLEKITTKQALITSTGNQLAWHIKTIEKNNINNQESMGSGSDLEYVEIRNNELDFRSGISVNQKIGKHISNDIDMLWADHAKKKDLSILDKIISIFRKEPKSVFQSEIFGNVLAEIHLTFQLFHKGQTDKMENIERMIKKKGNTYKSQLAKMLLELENPACLTTSDLDKKYDLDDDFCEFLKKVLISSAQEKINYLKDNLLMTHHDVDVYKTLVVEVPFICIRYKRERLLILSLQSPMDAVYAPSRTILVSSDSLRFNAAERLEKLYSWMIKNPSLYSRLWSPCDCRSFKFLVRDKRPYHVLLDELSGHYELVEAGYDLPKVFFARASFIEDSSLIDFRNPESHVFEEIVISNHRRANKDDFSERYFTFLKKSAAQFYGDSIVSVDAIFWISISGGEKRRWFEEQEALIAFIGWVKESFANFHFYVDGWTSPKLISEGDKNQIDSHKKIWEEICHATGLGENDYTNFIGTSIYKKIWGASQAVFFVSCAGTPSVWPSLINKVPGIVHNSRSMINKVANTYYPHNVYKIPDELITDVNELGDKIRWDKYSYSISVNSFIDSIDSFFKMIFPYNKPAEFYQALVSAKKKGDRLTLELLEIYCKEKLINYRNLNHIFKSSSFFGQPHVDIIDEEIGNYRIIDCDSRISSNVLFVTFGIVSSNIDHIPFAYPFLVNQNFKHIHIAQKKGTSYQDLSEKKLFDIMGPIIKRFKKIITYGTSLGGYSALYYSGVLDAQVIAGSPRLPLHPENLKFKGVHWKANSHWDEYPYKHTPLHHSLLTNKRVLVILDPLDPVDINFYENVIRPAVPQVLRLDVPHSKHASLNALNKLSKLKTLIIEEAV